MTKTPITDKIQRLLLLIEKINLSKTLDTGYDSSNYTKNWTQAGQDFDKFFGIDKFKEKYKPGTLLGYPKIDSKNIGGTDGNIAYKLFEQMREQKVDLLEVGEKTSNTKIQTETGEIKPAHENKDLYLWKSDRYSQVLNEETIATVTPIVASDRDNTFWRISSSNNIFVTRGGPAFENYLFANADGYKYKSYIHHNNGTMPGPPIGAGSVLLNYTYSNYKTFLDKAIQKIKPFITEENNTAFLNALADQRLTDLSIVIYDAILIGVLEAANTKIHPKYDSSSMKFPQGVTLLLPTESTLSTLESLITPTRSLDDVALPDDLKADIANTLNEIKANAGPYTDQFRKDLTESLSVKKYNLRTAVERAVTQLYNVVAQAVNQLNDVFQVSIDTQVEAGSLYLGSGLGWNKDRTTDFYKKINASVVTGTCPVTLLRVIKPSDNSPMRIESFVVDYVSKLNTFKLPKKEKAQSLDNEVHNYILNKIPIAIVDEKEVKDAYIDQFSRINDKAKAIYGSSMGKEFWKRVLDSTFNGKTKGFNFGVLFAGLSPLFWDEQVLGFDIKVSTVSMSTFETQPVSYNYDRASGKHTREDAPGGGVPCVHAVGIYFDRQYVGGGLASPRDISAEYPEVVKEREKYIIEHGNFKTLAEIRDEFLQELYQPESGLISTQQDLANLASTKVATILKNIKKGFWTADIDKYGNGTQLACFDPWLQKDQRVTELRRLNDREIIENVDRKRETAKKRYVTDFTEAEEEEGD